VLAWAGGVATLRCAGDDTAVKARKGGVVAEQRRERQDTVRFGDLFEVTQRLQEDAFGWYAQRRVPKSMQHLPSAALRKAEEICGGDWRRCMYDPRDESITIFNYPVWVPEREEDLFASPAGR
jgi:hypothetical protein